MPTTPPTAHARWCDSGQVAGLVADSLHTSPIGAWLVPDHDQRRAILTAVARIWVEHALLFGEVFLLADRSAAAVWFHRYRPIPPPASYRQRLAAACGDHLDRFRCLDLVLKSHRPAEAHNHLAILAVPPGASHAARTSGLLTRCLARMDHLVLPTYAEVATTAEASLYTRHGYIARDPFDLPDGITIRPLWREAAVQRAAAGMRSSNGRPGGGSEERRATAT